MNVICSCMKTTYTFDALVEAVAVQAGLDTSVPEDHTKCVSLPHGCLTKDILLSS